MSNEDRTCRYCGYRFETEADREAHIPCPERTGDESAPALFKRTVDKLIDALDQQQTTPSAPVVRSVLRIAGAWNHPALQENQR